MEACCETYLTNLEVNNAVIKGYIKGESSFNNFMNSLKKLGYSFATRHSKKYPTINDAHSNEHNYVLTGSSDVVIHYDKHMNSYFFISRRNYMKCIHGTNYYKKQPFHQDHPTGKKSRFYIKNSKKLDCPAIFHVIEKIHFEEEDLNVMDTIPSIMVKDMIWERISRGDCPKTIKLFHVSLSASNVHNHIITEQNMCSLFNLDAGMMYDTSITLSEPSNLSRGALENVIQGSKSDTNNDLKVIREIFQEAINATYIVTDTSNMQENIKKSLEVLNDLKSRSNKSNEDLSFLKSSKRKRCTKGKDDHCNKKEKIEQS